MTVPEAEDIARRSVLVGADEMAGFLQQHLGQKLTAYLAGIKDAKAVGQWAQGRTNPSAIVRERLRAAYHVTALFAAVYGDRAAQAWFSGRTRRSTTKPLRRLFAPPRHPTRSPESSLSPEPSSEAQPEGHLVSGRAAHWPARLLAPRVPLLERSVRRSSLEPRAH